MKKRLTLAVFFIAALGIAISSLFGVWTYRCQEISAARQTLIELLNLLDAQSNYTGPEALVSQFSAAVPDKRLTIIAPDGTVLADTLGEVTKNHADRPEFQSALSGKTGEAMRQSDTAGIVLLYEAKPFFDGNVGRISMPVSSVNALILRGVIGFLSAAAVALVLTLLLARILAARTAAPIERQEEALSAQGEKLQTVKSEFAANVSHELKTPLTSIKGFTDMLASGMVKKPEDQKQFITMIGVEVDRLIELINDVLKLSELESVAMPQPDERADLLDVAKKTMEFLEPVARSAGITLSVTGMAQTVSISANRLRELISNLVENGIKYNTPGGRVDIQVENREGRAVLTVSDTGIGIPPEAQERVFERFYRVDRGRTRKTGGSGLGLAIVKHITLLYGGSIHLESTVGKGSVFTVSFPAAT
ncbi:MAG: ATP-binding protein [Intestinimonas sp.]|jgi:two-component system phosphate regulon sensor histidine kinase PhoR|nr:ATP-binding protein [Intestinimonas sp.]